MMKILIIDDEAALCEALHHALTREDHQVDWAMDGLKGQTLLHQSTYDLLILDWMLPGMSGLELCRLLRQQGDTTPVLFLTAKDTLDDRVLGLDAGADDYLVKPFELRELLARVRALLRRSVSSFTPEQPTNSGRIICPEIELEPTEQLAYRNGRVIELSEKEAQLLGFFIQHTGHLLTHEQIYIELWQRDSPPNSNVLAALIRLLRRKITKSHEPQLIHTVYGKGYRFGINPDL